ncbi:MAG: xanthine dehydrogenase family protein molybdopterin-binding subunit [Burkholderiales bacterium]|nr:xanthine dehydrogenase family protein molybdopterin-binding subunit [Burkholderiales bacterium]
MVQKLALVRRGAAGSNFSAMATSAASTYAPARVEDAALVRGRGRYVTDVAPPGAWFAAFARSSHARGHLRGVDATAARAMPGVCAVLTVADIEGAVMPAINPLLPARVAHNVPLLADGVVLWVGQPVALVIAATLAQAQDAAEAVGIDVEALEATTDHGGVEPPLLALAYRSGSGSGDARMSAEVRLAQPRVCAAPLEPRAIVASWQDDRLTVWLPTQSPARARDDIAATLKIDRSSVRVIAPDVGGAFGAKASVTPEELAVALAARRLKATVRWTAARGEDFAAAPHGRGALLEGRLECDAEGRFTRLGARLRFPLGAWLPYSAAMPLRNAARILPGPYVVPAIDIDAEAAASDAAPMNIYRGAGRPEAALLMESLIDVAARAGGIDPVQLRRDNLVPASAMPWRTPTGETLDSGDYAVLLDLACTRFDYPAERAAQRARRAQGDLVGIGVAMYVEPCGQGWEWARVTLEADGRVFAASGAPAQGQGHATAFAAIVARALGIESRQVTVEVGDTETCPDGIGALASRSIAIGGSALHAAAVEAAARREAGAALPITVEKKYTAPGEAWSAGCVMLRLSIARDTGVPTIERLLWADDAGHIFCPQLAEGQLHGGLAQGLGQALMEAIRYDQSGQLLTGSFLDYTLPRAADMPDIEIVSLTTPATTNLLGAKGVGEAGCIGVPAALYNAAADALAPLRIVPPDIPLTAERLWRTIRNAPQGDHP